MRKWFYRFGIFIGITGVVAIAAVWLLEYYPRHGSRPPLKLARGTLAIEHARIYVSPGDPPIEDGTVLVKDGLIAAVGSNVDVPQGTTILPCDHCVVTAGFWNAHVHLTEPKWSMAQWKSAKVLNPQLADMFLSRGFTTVVDLGSNPANTLAIRRRVEKGELAGPYIYTSGTPLYPPHGVPYYVRDTTPGWLVAMMPQPSSPDQAARIVRDNLNSGADLTKLFTGSWIAHGHVLPMPLNVAIAAVKTTHLNGKLVFAHPSNLAGTQVAIQSGVDVLAHAPDATEGITPSLFQTMVRQNMGMTPTLKMFAVTVTTDPRYMDPIYEEVREFHGMGGTLMFGTDVGYMTDYSTEGEFEGLAKCGLDWKDVLAMLTTNPAARLGVQDRKGTVTAGKLADLTVLGADPAANLNNFAQVQMVVRSGRVVYAKSGMIASAFGVDPK